MTIITNKVPRDLLAWDDLTEAEQADLDYVSQAERENGSTRFFRFKGSVYDASEFEVFDPRYQFNKVNPGGWWGGFQSDSFFSAVLIRYTEDFEGVIVGRWFE